MFASDLLTLNYLYISKLVLSFFNTNKIVLSVLMIKFKIKSNKIKLYSFTMKMEKMSGILILVENLILF
jgi:hypothetical protein